MKRKISLALLLILLMSQNVFASEKPIYFDWSDFYNPPMQRALKSTKQDIEKLDQSEPQKKYKKELIVSLKDMGTIEDIRVQSDGTIYILQKYKKPVKYWGGWEGWDPAYKIIKYSYGKLETIADFNGENELRFLDAAHPEENKPVTKYKMQHARLFNEGDDIFVTVAIRRAGNLNGPINPNGDHAVLTYYLNESNMFTDPLFFFPAPSTTYYKAYFDQRIGFSYYDAVERAYYAYIHEDLSGDYPRMEEMFIKYKSSEDWNYIERELNGPEGKPLGLTQGESVAWTNPDDNNEINIVYFYLAKGIYHFKVYKDGSPGKLVSEQWWPSCIGEPTIRAIGGYIAENNTAYYSRWFVPFIYDLSGAKVAETDGLKYIQALDKTEQGWYVYDFMEEAIFELK